MTSPYEREPVRTDSRGGEGKGGEGWGREGTGGEGRGGEGSQVIKSKLIKHASVVQTQRTKWWIRRSMEKISSIQSSQLLNCSTFLSRRFTLR